MTDLKRIAAKFLSENPPEWTEPERRYVVFDEVDIRVMELTEELRRRIEVIGDVSRETTEGA